MTVDDRHSAAQEIDSAWQALLSTALLGTERRPFVPPTLPGKLGALVSDATAEDGEPAPERQLLRAAGLLALYQGAGRLVERTTDPLPAPCAADERPACGPAAGQRLAEVLDGFPQELLADWLALIAEAGKRTPPAQLPALLDYGQRQPKFVEPIRAVLGERGHWLAAQNPDWAYGEALSPAIWQTGSRAQRRLLLSDRRRQEPDAAREMLASTWPQETAQDRAFFLGLLATGLNAADEPFLEAALDDRSDDVRRTAADLLARLPGSAFRARMQARAEAILHHTPGRWPLRAEKLEIRLPEGCDAAMQRDGVDLPAAQKWGEKAGWAYQILKAIPPSHWSDRWARPPAVLLSLAEKDEWAELLVTAWATAVAQHGDSLWAEAMLRGGLFDKDILTVLAPDAQEAILLDLLEEAPSVAVLELALAGHRPWRPRLSRAFIGKLAAIYEAMKRSGVIEWQIRQRLQHLAYALDLDVARTPAIWPAPAESDANWQQLMTDLRETLELRADMRREILE